MGYSFSARAIFEAIFLNVVDVPAFCLKNTSFRDSTGRIRMGKISGTKGKGRNEKTRVESEVQRGS